MEKESFEAKMDSTAYMSDELGLHRVENPSHSNSAVSLHLYSPPFKSCQVRTDLFFALIGHQNRNESECPNSEDLASYLIDLHW